MNISFKAQLLILFFSSVLQGAEPIYMLNASYDPTRELYQDMNTAFRTHWKSTHPQDITIRQSHGGSGKQARAVIDGLEADVVTLGLAYDIDAIAAHSKLLPKNWQSRLPHHSTPYTSTIVFLVRKGNPKHIRDWDDLIKPGVSVITPNPKTSGGARWNYLAAWGYALKKYNNDPVKAKAFVQKLFKNVPVLDSGARGATTTFLERGIGDVLIAWENEAYLAVEKSGKERVAIVAPSVSILAEPPVTVVDQIVDKHKTRQLAEAYVNFLYTQEAQKIALKHHFRPTDAQMFSVHKKSFTAVDVFTIDDVFGGWAKAQKTHFSDGGTFDQIYQ